MDIVFLKSNELNWEENLARAKKVLGDNIEVIDGSKMTKKEAYAELARRKDRFMMIEGDNWVFDNAGELLDLKHSCKFWARSPYGFDSGHGGIKVLTGEDIEKALKKVVTEHDISVFIHIPFSKTTYSEHRFNTTAKNEFLVAAKEIIKLIFWDKLELLEMWKNGPPITKKICSIVENNLSGCDFEKFLDPKEMNSFLTDLFYREYLKIGVIGICKNEEHWIDIFLKLYKTADKIVLLDTGSTDKTREKIVGENVWLYTKEYEKTNFGQMRQDLWSILLEEHNDLLFTIVLDMDEMMENFDIEKIKEWIGEQKPDIFGFDILRKDACVSTKEVTLRRIIRLEEGEWINPIHEGFCFRDDQKDNFPRFPFDVLHLETEMIQRKDKMELYTALLEKGLKEALEANDPKYISWYSFYLLGIYFRALDKEKMLNEYKRFLTFTEIDIPEAIFYFFRFFNLLDNEEEKARIIEVSKKFLDGKYYTSIHAEPVIIAEVLAKIDEMNDFVFSDAVFDTPPKFTKGIEDDFGYPIRLTLEYSGGWQAVTDIVLFENYITRFFGDLVDVKQVIDGDTRKTEISSNNNILFFKMFFSNQARYVGAHVSKSCLRNGVKRKMYFEKLLNAN